MGYNTTVLVLNDALDQIESDPQFGAKLAQAVRQVDYLPGRVDVSAGCHANAAAVIETHHADYTALVAVGGNYATPLLQARGWKHHTREEQVKLLHALASHLGFDVIEKTTTP